MAALGSVTDEEKNFTETWENVSQSSNYILRTDYRGDTKPTQITPTTRSFKITTYERILTEDQIVDPRHDPFKNGCFRPVLVPDEVSVETNPNALSDEDIMRIFASSDNAWESYTDVIDAPETLSRMVRLAEDSDEVSLKRFRQVEEMHNRNSNIGKKVAGQKDENLYQQIQPGDMNASAPAPKVTTTRGPGRPPKNV